MATFNVFCGTCKSTYTQTGESIPYCCGVCGSRFIRAVAHPGPQMVRMVCSNAAVNDTDEGRVLPYATCRDCGATYDPSKGSCGCHDNACQ